MHVKVSLMFCSHPRLLEYSEIRLIEHPYVTRTVRENAGIEASEGHRLLLSASNFRSSFGPQFLKWKVEVSTIIFKISFRSARNVFPNRQVCPQPTAKCKTATTKVTTRLTKSGCLRTPSNFFSRFASNERRLIRKPMMQAGALCAGI